MKKFLGFMRKKLLVLGKIISAPLIPDSIETQKDFIFRIIWFAFACACFVIGAIMGIIFSSWSFWVTWALICGIPFLPAILKTMGKIIGTGYKIGAKNKHTYVDVRSTGPVGINPNSQSYEIKKWTGDDSFQYAYVAAFASLFLMLLIVCTTGPIVLGIKLVLTAIVIYKYKKGLETLEKE